MITNIPKAECSKARSSLSAVLDATLDGVLGVENRDNRALTTKTSERLPPLLRGLAPKASDVLIVTSCLDLGR